MNAAAASTLPQTFAVESRASIRVLQVTEDHSPANTGITSMVDALVRQVQPVLPQTVLSTGSEAIPLPEGVAGIQLPIAAEGRAWRAAPSASQKLIEAVQNTDIVHLHGIWMWVQWATARQATRQYKPFLLSVHGMLEPWMWQRQHWIHQYKKRLYWQAVAYPAFRQACLIHAVHPTEAGHLKAYFPEVPIQVIPHSVDLDSIDASLADTPLNRSQNPYILFMGRLHPVKGIHLLIEALARLKAPKLRMIIAGPIEAREAAYATQLKEQVQQAGIEEQVDFLGMVQGQQKWALLRDAWAVCLPSYSEAIGMVNLEAAACRTPVITTHASGLPHAWVEAGGMLVAPEVDALVGALQQAQHWTSAERTERGERLRKLVETSYSWKATAARWIELYQHLTGKA